MTQHIDEAASKEAGAPEIEVTCEMIKVGVEIAWGAHLNFRPTKTWAKWLSVFLGL
jgi:hypothetical protein